MGIVKHCVYFVLEKRYINEPYLAHQSAELSNCLSWGYQKSHR